MAVLRDDSQPVRFELPDGDAVDLVTWAYIMKKLEIEMKDTLTNMSMINEYLKRINNRVDYWLAQQSDE